MRKVNVWKLGYTTFKDFILNNDNVECRPMGYVELEDDDDPEDTWHFLNWSCWTQTKPDKVKSSISYCNSEIIIQEEGSDEYHVCKPVGWEIAKNLEEAIKVSKAGRDFRYPLFPEVLVSQEL